MSGHTPGPWSLAEIHDLGLYMNDGSITIMAPDPDQDSTAIASVVCKTRYKRGLGHKAECEIRDANARLIAAAPELVEALRQAVRTIASMGADLEVAAPESVNANSYQDELRRLRAAIAKATGDRP